MDYFRILNLKKEPFSNSPDPDFFYESGRHLECLQKIELAVRLRRGLNFVVGDVGTGKTTLCRQLIRKFAADENIDTHLILDPGFKNPLEFLFSVAEMFNEEIFNKEQDGKNIGERQLKEIIKQNIFRRGVDEGKIIVLIIDEGQKMPLPCLEILREFLNFETNEAKLLQIVIFAQKEIEKNLENYENFADRINLYHILKPMNFSDTKSMIEYRLEKSAETAGHTFNPFSYFALLAIYRFTRGYPRKIVTLCHTSIMAMIIQNKTTAGLRLVRSCMKRSFMKISGHSLYKKRFSVFAVVLIICLISASLIYKFWPGILQLYLSYNNRRVEVSLQDSDILPNVIKIPLLTREAPLTIESGTIESVTIEPVKIEDVGRGPESAINTNQSEEPINNLINQGEHEQKTLDNRKPKEDYTPLTQPVLLGRVSMKQNETLWKLIEKVYGLCTPQHLKAVLLMNSEIENQNHVEVGQEITLPAIPVEKKIFPQNVWLVKLEDKATLGDALEYLRLYPALLYHGKTFPVHLITYWNNREGLKYAICFNGFFMTEESVLKYFSSLDLAVYPAGEVVVLKTDETIFFTDPGFVLVPSGIGIEGMLN